jgi:tetratricopeptide (TPR) repeat protein
MNELSENIKDIENQIEKALWGVEMHEELGKALEIYKDAEIKLEKLGINADDPAYAEKQRVLSYCLMRQGNILRQMKKPQQALEISEREITAARASGDGITLARSLMSNGINRVVSGEIDRGSKMLEEALQLFKNGKSYDHKQGVGWCWIIQADLANSKLVEREPAEVVDIATRALDILKPIENWPGVARAYAARAEAHEKLGNAEEAAKDRQEQKVSESNIEQE